VPSAPHLVRWDQDYAKKGLTILVNFGEKGETFDAVKALVKAKEMAYPVLYDKDESNNKTFGVKAQPFAYLAGVEGTVVWEGTLVPNRDALEKAIVAQLELVKK